MFTVGLGLNKILIIKSELLNTATNVMSLTKSLFYILYISLQLTICLTFTMPMEGGAEKSMQYIQCTNIYAILGLICFLRLMNLLQVI